VPSNVPYHLFELHEGKTIGVIQRTNNASARQTVEAQQDFASMIDVRLCFEIKERMKRLLTFKTKGKQIPAKIGGVVIFPSGQQDGQSGGLIFLMAN
jgi:hypothetical protein